MRLRDDKWLYQLLDEVWDQHFGDVVQDNDVRIVFGRKAKNRLVSIKVDPKDPRISIITMNGLFRDERVPEFVIKATLVHEMSHYAHGFNSPIEQKYRHPHAGGVMRREFAQRGLEQLYIDQRKWLKDNWRGVVNDALPKTIRQTKNVARKATRIPKPFWFIG